jgi:hypothetical protein
VNYFVYAVAILMLISVALFIAVAIFKRRPQKTGLIAILLAVPLFMIYYNDRWPFEPPLRMRDALLPIERLRPDADIRFASDIAPALIIAILLLVHMTVLQRVAVRERLQKVQNPIANFFAGATAATLIGASLVSTFHWGWVGAVIIAFIFALVYLGIVTLVAALLEVVVEIFKFFLVWLKRKVFALATLITRASSWVSSLSGRLGLRSFADRIRQDTLDQESLFLTEQEDQDRRLYEAYLRDRAHRRRMLRGGPIPEDGSEAPFLPPPVTADPTPPVPPTPASVPPTPASVAPTPAPVE